VTALPMLPKIDAFKSAPHIAASQAERLLACELRFLLDQDLALRSMQPYSAAALVGTAAHAALAALTRAHEARPLDEAPKDTRAVARQAFDLALTFECSRRDRAIASRGELPGDSTEEPSALPFYSMTRARLARLVHERFGPDWSWREPIFGERAASITTTSTRHDALTRHDLRAIEPELRLRSADGLIVGVADSVEQHDGTVVIEELKSGEATTERLAGWRRQLLIYGHLYSEQFGHAPSLLRVRSLPDGVRDFPYAADEAAQAVDDLRAAFRALNARIATGASAGELARPSQAGCPGCPHRPWCEPYWAAGVAIRSDADLEGMIGEVDGWTAVIEVISGTTLRVDFRASGVAPRAATRVRICGARLDPGGTLRCTRLTSVWRVPA
jgi:hypothetical protein